LKPGIHQKLRAYTLTEILIAIALVAILTAVAIPSYRDYIVRASRSEATDALLNAARCQERLYAKFNAFNANLCGGATPNGLYTVTITTSNSNQNFVATATPAGGQSADACGNLTLSDTGVKTAHGNTGDYAQNCWVGKTVTGSS